MMFENLTNITPNHLGGICMLASNSLIHPTSEQEINLTHDAVAWQHLCIINPCLSMECRAQSTSVQSPNTHESTLHGWG